MTAKNKAVWFYDQGIYQNYLSKIPNGIPVISILWQSACSLDGYVRTYYMCLRISVGEKKKSFSLSCQVVHVVPTYVPHYYIGILLQPAEPIFPIPIPPDFNSLVIKTGGEGEREEIKNLKSGEI